MAPTFLNYHNQKHGTNLSIDDLKSYYVEEVTCETQEQMLAKIEAYLSTVHYTEGKPIEGSVEAIERLSRKYELVVVTSRDSFYRGSTEKFIEEHYPGLFSGLQYTHQVETPDIMVSKSEICKEISAVAIIDDHLKNITECAEHGIEGILFGNYAWNQTKQLPAGVTRLLNWQEVAVHLGV